MHLRALRLRGAPFVTSFKSSIMTLAIPNKSLTIGSYVPLLMKGNKTLRDPHCPRSRQPQTCCSQM